jgi:hypothetical protein
MDDSRAFGFARFDILQCTRTHLAQAGLLDRTATEEALRGGPASRSFNLELLHYLNIEAWAHAWTPDHALTAAAMRSAARYPEFAY